MPRDDTVVGWYHKGGGRESEETRVKRETKRDSLYYHGWCYVQHHGRKPTESRGMVARALKSHYNHAARIITAFNLVLLPAERSRVGFRWYNVCTHGTRIQWREKKGLAQQQGAARQRQRRDRMRRMRVKRKRRVRAIWMRKRRKYTRSKRGHQAVFSSTPRGVPLWKITGVERETERERERESRSPRVGRYCLLRSRKEKSKSWILLGWRAYQTVRVSPRLYIVCRHGIPRRAILHWTMRALFSCWSRVRTKIPTNGAVYRTRGISAYKAWSSGATIEESSEKHYSY